MNYIDKPNNQFRDFRDCYWMFDPTRTRNVLGEFLKTINIINGQDEYIDKIYDHIKNLFKFPGAALIEIEVETQKSGELWTIDNRESYSPVDPIVQSISLDVLYSLYLLRVYNVDLSDRHCKIRVEYVCMTPLGIEFMIKCDHELQRSLLAAP
jgi:hypothetical protein